MATLYGMTFALRRLQPVGLVTLENLFGFSGRALLVGLVGAVSSAKLPTY